jgi:hypothetical protein
LYNYYADGDVHVSHYERIYSVQNHGTAGKSSPKSSKVVLESKGNWQH